MKRREVFFCCIFFILGIGIAYFFVDKCQYFCPRALYLTSSFYVFLFAILNLSLAVIFWKNKSMRIIFLCTFFLFLGGWRFFMAMPADTDDKIWYYNKKELSFLGVVGDEVKSTARGQKLEIKSFYLNNKRVNGKVLINARSYPEYNYGDILKIECELEAPEKFDDFAYDKYLARYGIYSLCRNPKIIIIKKEDLDSNEKDAFDKIFLLTPVFKNIYKLKNKLSETINIGISEPYASLANAMVLGCKKDMPDDLRENFSKIGLSHIAAISGMHISILVAIFFNIILRIGLKRKYAFYLSSLFLVFYVIIIGMPASAVRASIMGFLVLLAMHLGRVNKLSHSLVIVCVFLLMINPKLLVSDIGFQLSFLAVFGIAYFYPIFKKVKNKLPGFFQTKVGGIIFDIIAVTMAAQVFTLPLIAYNFRTVSIISPISNLLVLWSLPFVLVGLIVALILSLIIPDLALLFFLIPGMLLRYIVLVSEFLVDVPFSYFQF